MMDNKLPLSATPMMDEQQASSTSLDLPPSLEAIISQTLAAPQQMPSPGVQGALTGNFSLSSPAPPSFAAGGQVGPGGMPIRPGQGQAFQPPMMPPAGGPGLPPPGQGQQLSTEQILMEAERFGAQRPVEMQQIQAVLQEGIANGEFTVEELNVVVQLAMAAVQNPDLYPQLRNSAIQQGIADEEDLPPQYDPGFLFVLILVGEALGASTDMQQPEMSMRQGGALPERSKNPDGSVPITAHEGEYVVPKEVVRMKGVEFFDNLVAKYRDDKMNKGGSQ